MDRVATFRQFIESSPEDPFPRYGLAMEFKSQGRAAEAEQSFAELVERFPDYVPTYLMYGGLVGEQGRHEQARGILERGVQVARAAGDDHAQGELEDALAAL